MILHQTDGLPRTPPDPVATRNTTCLVDWIRREIAAADGLLPFDRFMELALYAPAFGYYVAGAPKFGPGGDFVTAPEVSPLFGGCLALQAAEVLERMGGGDLLEFGAGSGALAAQVLAGLEHQGTLPDRYLILEPSPDLQTRQRELIAARVPHLAERCQWLSGLPARFRGLMLANEVLDAMPVHRFRIGDAGEPLEVFVTERDGVLTEITGPIRSVGLAAAIADLHAAGLARQPGYQSEINLRLGPWCQALGTCLSTGLVLLIDYGYPASAYYQADRSLGTLMCHWRHQAHGDPYQHVGLQDISAHVDFTAVANAARDAGLEVAGFATQAQFLIGCGIDQLLVAGAVDGIPAMEATQAVKQLLLPTAMGERFKVLGLSRALPGPWRGFSMRDLQDRL